MHNTNKITDLVLPEFAKNAWNCNTLNFVNLIIILL